MNDADKLFLIIMAVILVCGILAWMSSELKILFGIIVIFLVILLALMIEMPFGFNNGEDKNEHNDNSDKA